MTGKIPLAMLERYVLGRVGVRDERVVVGPSVGEDAAVIRLNEDYLVVHADPITEAVYRIGWLAVHIASNDVAVRGARPRWITSVIMLPEGFGEEVLDEITRDMDEAAQELGAMIVGGHTEETPRLDRPMVVCTVMGLARRYVSTAGARPGDLVVLVGEAGLEGTAIIASDFPHLLRKRGVGEDVIRSALGLYREISVVEQALRLAELGATSMHDPTEGGLLGGLVEVALASGTEIEVWEDRIPLRRETRMFAEALNIDPLRLISSGALVATLPPGLADKLGSLGKNYAVIGRVKEKERGLVVIHRKDGRVEKLDQPPIDEITRIWEEAGSET